MADSSGLCTRITIDGTPSLVVAPGAADRNGSLALWIPPLGGAKEASLPLLARMADSGFVAVSIDPRQHGERTDDVAGDVSSVVLTAYRSAMWPILGGTVLDALAVVGWATCAYALDGDVVVGGISMGGDIAIALAGIEPRVARAIGVGSTSDWARPGMTVAGDSSQVIDQGDAGSLGDWLFQHLNPIAHLSSYQRDIAIRFHVGTADTHVPGDAARRFAGSFSEGSAPHVDVVEHLDMDHEGVTSSEEIVADAVEWLIQA